MLRLVSISSTAIHLQQLPVYTLALLSGLPALSPAHSFSLSDYKLFYSMILSKSLIVVIPSLQQLPGQIQMVSAPWSKHRTHLWIPVTWASPCLLFRRMMVLNTTTGNASTPPRTPIRRRCRSHTCQQKPSISYSGFSRFWMILLVFNNLPILRGKNTRTGTGIMTELAAVKR